MRSDFSARQWAIVSLISLSAFALLAILIQFANPLTTLDIQLGRFLHDLYYTWNLWWLFDKGMQGISLFGREVIFLIAVVVAIILVLRRTWVRLAFWLGTVGGAVLINRLVKGYFVTFRPMVGHEDILEVSTGFPSGHVMMAVVTYGLLAYFILRWLRIPYQAIVVLGGVACLVLGVSISRLYLSVHYLSDVLGGLALGLGWLALCISIYKRYEERV